MMSEPFLQASPEPEGDPTLEKICDQLILSLCGKLQGRIDGTYRLLGNRVLGSLPEPAAQRIRQSPASERALLRSTLENLLRSDPRTRQLAGVILTPPDQTTRGSGLRKDDRVRILVLSAQPDRMSTKSRVSLPRLRTDEEARQIQEGVRRGPLGRQFDVTVLPAARVEDLSWGLLEYEPDILHFSGHGFQGAIQLERPDGSAWEVTGEQLARLFGIFKGGRLRCVVLNACESGLEAEPIAREVGAAVARCDTVPDQAAIVFAEFFYQGLGFGQTLGEAFDLGCWHVDALGGWGDTAQPQFLGEAREIRFAAEPV
jgi:hypothetical protein